MQAPQRAKWPDAGGAAAGIPLALWERGRG